MIWVKSTRAPPPTTCLQIATTPQLALKRPTPPRTTSTSSLVFLEEASPTGKCTEMMVDQAQPTSSVSISGHEEPRSRAPEFYGFVAWTSTSLAFVVYVLWATLRDEQLHSLGITWYPNRYVCSMYIGKGWYDRSSFIANGQSSCQHTPSCSCYSRILSIFLLRLHKLLLFRMFVRLLVGFIAVLLWSSA